MMRKVLLLLAVLALHLVARGQGQGYVQVTGTKACYGNGSVNAAFVNLSGGNQLPLLNGSVFPTTGVTNFDSAGVMSFYVADNSQVIPSPSQWTFTACAKSGGQPPCGTFQASITGPGPVNVSSQMSTFTCPPSGGGGGGGNTSSAWIDVLNDLHCDPTGAISCLPLVQTAAAAQPTATFMFGVPPGQTAANYLMTNGADAVLPPGITLQFQMGATISTGSQAAGTVSSITRMTGFSGTPNYASPEAISVSSCTSSSSAGVETFTNCPNTFSTTVVYTDGLTHVANCYRGCQASTTNGTSFDIINPAAGTVAPGPETGSVVKSDHAVFLDLSQPGYTTSSNAAGITINGPNPLPASSGPSTAIGNVLQLAGTTNVPHGIYVISASSPTSISLICLTCGTIAAGPETGDATFVPGGVAQATFSTPLAGTAAFTPGFYGPQGQTKAGVGRVVCQGTTGGSFDGPFWITNFLSSTSFGFLDARMGSTPSTAGSCAVPFVLTVTGSVVAATTQQIIANNSAITLLGNDPIYVGWYGAKGSAVSTNDFSPIQNSLFWNPSRHVVAPTLTGGQYGFLIGTPPDYILNDSLQIYGNAQWFDGITYSLLSNGTTLQCNSTGPCIIGRADTPDVHISSFTMVGTECVIPNNVRLEPFVTFMGQDAVYVGGGLAKVDNIDASCFTRNGVVFSSVGGFNNLITGNPEPDYWHAQNLSFDDMGGYGFVCLGNDCNGGNLSGTNDSSAAFYGGYFDQSQFAGTYTQANGQANSQNFGGGPAVPLTNLTVSGSGLNASCTYTPVQTGRSWVTIAGTGASNVDGTWNANNTGTFPCPGASGGPYTTGTVATADALHTYTAIQTYSNGFLNNTWTIAGLVNSAQVVINPYSEGTNGCTSGSGTYVGGSLGEFFYQGQPPDCYGKPSFSGVWIGKQENGALGVFSNQGLFVRSLTSASNFSETLFNAPWNGLGTAFTGAMGNVYSTNTDENNHDWFEGVGSGDIFQIQDFIDGSFPLEIQPTGQGNQTNLGAPSATGLVGFKSGASSVAPTGACLTNGQWVFTADGHATFCAGGTWTTKI